MVAKKSTAPKDGQGAASKADASQDNAGKAADDGNQQSGSGDAVDFPAQLRNAEAAIEQLKQDVPGLISRAVAEEISKAKESLSDDILQKVQESMSNPDSEEKPDPAIDRQKQDDAAAVLRKEKAAAARKADQAQRRARESAKKARVEAKQAFKSAMSHKFVGDLDAIEPTIVTGLLVDDGERFATAGNPNINPETDIEVSPTTGAITVKKDLEIGKGLPERMKFSGLVLMTDAGSLRCEFTGERFVGGGHTVMLPKNSLSFRATAAAVAE